MVHLRRWTALLAAVVMLVASSLVAPATEAASQPKQHSGRIIVKHKSHTSPTQRSDSVKKHRGAIKQTLKNTDSSVVQVQPGQEAAVAAALRTDPTVEYAEVDQVARVAALPNDTYVKAHQWAIKNSEQSILGYQGKNDADIDADQAWEKSKGNGVKVAVLDTGIDSQHPDIAGKVVQELNITSSPGTYDSYGHGTHVAGIIAAKQNNSTGITGVCPGCTLLNIKVLGDDGFGYYSWIADGIIYATNQGAKVINLSLGGYSPSQLMQDAIRYAVSRGVIVPACAGNDNTSQPQYPGYYPETIAVAATNNYDQKAYFSNYGASWVDLAAPGEHILSTLPVSGSYMQSQSPLVMYNKGAYGYFSGCSMATPMVSGAAGLVWASKHGTSAANVRKRLESNVDKISGTGQYWSKGRLNAYKALNN